MRYGLFKGADTKDNKFYQKALGHHPNDIYKKVVTPGDDDNVDDDINLVEFNSKSSKQTKDKKGSNNTSKASKDKGHDRNKSKNKASDEIVIQ